MARQRSISAALIGAAVMVSASAAHAANVTLDDSVPDEVTVNWGSFDRANMGRVVGVTSNLLNGSATVQGETVQFKGDWTTINAPTGSAGVIYFVDPSQPDIVRARVDATWSHSVLNASIDVTVTSSPFGDLGTIPAAFAGLGVPMPDGVIGIKPLFRSPSSTNPTSPPGNLTIQYVGDFAPECADPVLLAQPPNNVEINISDSSGALPFEQADDVLFAQDVSVTSMRWWGAYATSNTAEAGVDNFTMYVYENDGGIPAASPTATVDLSGAGRAGTGLTTTGYNEFVYASELPAPLLFKANTRYWIAIVNDTATDVDDEWYWSSGSGGNNVRSNRTPPLTGAWVSRTRDRALELCGDVVGPVCPADLNTDSFVDGADLAALLASWGSCDVPLESRLPDTTLDARFSDTDAAGTLFEHADRVNPGSDLQVGVLRWWGAYAKTGTVQADADDFTLSLYAEDGGSVAESPYASFPLHPTRADTGTTNTGGRPIYVYETALPLGVVFEASALQYMSILNNTVNDPDDNWGWQTSSDEDGILQQRSTPGSGAWGAWVNDLAFELLTSCDSDLNGDGVIDGADLAALLAAWGPCAAP